MIGRTNASNSITQSSSTISGEENSVITFNGDGSITQQFQTYKTDTTFDSTGNITETSTYSDKKIIKTTIFNKDGTIGINIEEAQL